MRDSDKMNVIDHSFRILNDKYSPQFPCFSIQVTLNEFLRALKETLDLEKNQESIPVGEL
jgi:hypothetical protein